MMNQGPVNHLKNKYVGLIHKSSILFTAPHSKRLNRGGQLYKERLRIHKRQIYTSFITCDLAKHTGKQSFLFWGTSNLISDQDIDPNYMMKQQFGQSPFHQGLQCWALMNQEQPILHVDIHGKMDRQKNCEIDVGILSMEVHWHGDPLIESLKGFFSKQGDIFGGYTFKGFQCKFNTDPDLHGYWGSKVHTMTEQAIMLGIPSIQLQIPFSVRKKMLRDSELRGRFHSFIRKLYNDVIVPDFKTKKRALKLSAEIGKLYVPTPSIKGEKEREEVYQQILRFQTKEEASPNPNKNI